MKVEITGDRIFAGVAVILVAIYAYFAFVEISAPIQYDPLGPEGWPRFLATVALLLCVLLLRRPEDRAFTATAATVKRVMFAAALVAGYAVVFEWLGFALATALFCSGFARLLGATRTGALLFGIVTGAGLYVVAVHLLGLNLPPGELLAVWNRSP